jgi:ABC-type ATPase involved in cell division
LDITRLERVAVLVATHNLGLIGHMNRVLTLEEGRLVPFVAPVAADSV